MLRLHAATGDALRRRGVVQSAHTPSRQLCVLRALDAAHFDGLAAILFNADYSRYRSAIIPRAAGLKGATCIVRTSCRRVMHRDPVWTWPETRDVTLAIQAARH